MRWLPVVLLATALVGCGETTPAKRTAISEPSPASFAATATPDSTITIAAVGDIMLARDLVTLMDEHGALYPYERVAHLLSDADITVANMEGAFTERGLAADKLYTFRTPPRFAGGLAQAGIGFVSLGNNHAADFGEEGVADTIAALDAAGVLHSGAGLDERAARSPAVIDVDGVRLAFLSYTDIEENTFATATSFGAARATVESITSDVRAARRTTDAVIVSLHSGVEYTDAPDAGQQRLARAAVDAGAALVLGHHPHALEGWEWYGDGLIAYSLGNFVFDLDAEDLAQLGPRAFRTGVLYVRLREGEVLDVRLEPVVIDPVENRPRPATAPERREILDRQQYLNGIAGGP